MQRDYWSLWVAFKNRKESLIQLAKKIGIPKSELSVAFRVISQMEGRINYLEREIDRLRKELQRCYEEKETTKGVGSFLKRLIGG
jgi:uncharacterized small protein (DUF1192 family)